jgi:hypothetical protein
MVEILLGSIALLLAVSLAAAIAPERPPGADSWLSASD